MPNFDVQAVGLKTGHRTAFDYIADPANLAAWTHAFKWVENGRAALVTPKGSLDIGLEMDGDEAASVLGIRPAAFRKRLSQAREAVFEFTRAKCGLVSPARPCRCRRRVTHALRLGRVDPKRLLFATESERAQRFPAVLAEIRKLEEVRRAAALYRSHPEFVAPAGFAAEIRKLIRAEAG